MAYDPAKSLILPSDIVRPACPRIGKNQDRMGIGVQTMHIGKYSFSHETLFSVMCVIYLKKNFSINLFTY